MSVTRNILSDPAGSLPSFTWEFNHAEEEATEKTRTVERGANTAGTGLVRQQGDDSPIILTYSGTIFTEAELVRFLKYWKACRDRTVRFTDYASDQYEVIITSFSAPRKRTLWNPRDTANAPYHYSSFRITMEVITILAGPYLTAGVNP